MALKVFTSNGELKVTVGSGGGGISDGDKGDITVSGSGAVWTIDNDVVTFAKFQNINTDRLLGRDTAAAGDVEEISLNATLEWTGAGAIQRAALTGDVTAAAGSNATAITNNAVTNLHLRDSAANSVIGRATNTAGDPADIAAGTDGHVLRLSGTTLGFGTVATGGIADNAVTFAKLADMNTDRLIGRDTAAAGDPEEISLNATLEFTGAGAIQRAALTGDVTASAGSNATSIANDVVTDAKLRNSAANSVIGRATNSAGDPADISTSTDGHVLRMSGTTLGFGTVATAGHADDSITFAKMQNINTDRLIGRDTAASGDPEEISLNATLEFTGAGAIQRAALTGDVTASAGSNATTIANNVVTYAKFQDSGAGNVVLTRANAAAGDYGETALSASQLLGRGSTGDVAAITLGTNLSMSGTTLNATGGGGSNTTAFVKLSEHDASASATIDIPLDDWPGYRSFVIVAEGVQPSVDASELFMRFSTDGGSTFDAGASDYAWDYTATALGTGVSAGDNADNEIQVAEALESTAGTGALNFIMWIHDPHTVGTRTNANWTAGYSPNSAGNSTQISGTGARLTAQDTTDVRFLMDTGNIQTGKFILYGVAATTDGQPDIEGRKKRLEIFDDFVVMGGVSATLGDVFKVDFTGTGAQVTSATTDVGAADHPGIAQLERGTTTTGRAAVRTDLDTLVTGGSGTEAMVFETMVRVEDLSDATNEYDLRAGFIDSVTGDSTDGMYFEYDRNTRTNWSIVAAGAATRTRSDSGTAVAADTWYKLRVVYDSTVPQARFYINGVETTNSPITGANLPTGFAERFGCGVMLLGSAGTTDRFAYVDYCMLQVNLTTTR